MTITLRSNLSRPLTPDEADGNITDLNARITTVQTQTNTLTNTTNTLSSTSLNATTYTSVNNSGFLLFSPILDVTRNSLNAATDTNEVVMATWVLPVNSLRVGSMIDIIALWENTNSANTKNFITRINGTGVGNTAATTNQSTGFRQPYHIHDNTTLIYLNNGSVGTGAATTLLSTAVLNDTTTQTNTITLNCKWTTQPIAGEFIRLKHAKLHIIY